MFEKYKWKNRILLIKTSNYKNLKYKKIKSLYQNNIKKSDEVILNKINK